MWMSLFLTDFSLNFISILTHYENLIRYKNHNNCLLSHPRCIPPKVLLTKGTFFLYVEAPLRIAGGLDFDTAEDFSFYLLSEYLISTVPWDDAGRYIRWSITYTAVEAEELNVMNQLVEILAFIHF